MPALHIWNLHLGSQRDPRDELLLSKQAAQFVLPTSKASGVKTLVGGREGYGEHPPCFTQVQSLSYKPDTSPLILTFLELQDLPPHPRFLRTIGAATLAGTAGSTHESLRGDKVLNIRDWCKSQPAREEKWGVKQHNQPQL